MFDGHLSHVWYGHIKLARDNNVTILKLLPHTTDLSQPLDVAVFKSLKDTWGRELFKRLRLTRSKLTKSEFSALIASPGVWCKVLSEEHIKSGFWKCGIVSLDRSKYPVQRFNENLKRRYDKWVEEGKPI